MTLLHRVIWSLSLIPRGAQNTIHHFVFEFEFELIALRMNSTSELHILGIIKVLMNSPSYTRHLKLANDM